MCSVEEHSGWAAECFGMLWIYCRAGRGKDPDPALKNWDMVGQESRVAIQCTAKTLGNVQAVTEKREEKSYKNSLNKISPSRISRPSAGP